MCAICFTRWSLKYLPLSQIAPQSSCFTQTDTWMDRQRREDLPKCVKRFFATCKSAYLEKQWTQIALQRAASCIFMYIYGICEYDCMCLWACAAPGTPLWASALSGRPKLKWGPLKYSRNSAGWHARLSVCVCNRKHTHFALLVKQRLHHRLYTFLWNSPYF